MYNEEYYKSLNYADYLSRGRRYTKTAEEITSLLNSLNLLYKGASILDYGCAVGFLTKSLYDLGYKSYGYDISSWAVKEAKKLGVTVIDKPEGLYDCVFYLDVLEHMTDENIEEVFSNIKTKSCVVRIPCSTDGGNTFHLDVSNKDKTHINCKDKKGWMSLFSSLGVIKILNLNTLTIYDSPGVYCALLLF